MPDVFLASCSKACGALLELSTPQNSCGPRRGMSWQNLPTSMGTCQACAHDWARLLLHCMVTKDQPVKWLLGLLGAWRKHGPFIKGSGKRAGSFFSSLFFGGRRGKSKGLELKVVKQYSDHKPRQDSSLPSAPTSLHTVEGMVDNGGWCLGSVLGKRLVPVFCAALCLLLSSFTCLWLMCLDGWVSLAPQGLSPFSTPSLWWLHHDYRLSGPSPQPQPSSEARSGRGT